MKIDRDILEVEQRIARRRLAVELTARAAWRRTVKKVISPVGLLGAAALGFVTVAGVFRRQPQARAHYSSKTARAGKWGSVAGLLASGAFALLRAQYGSPANIANMVIRQVKDYQQRRQHKQFGAGYVAR
jgi:hypothetical protein